MSIIRYLSGAVKFVDRESQTQPQKPLFFNKNLKNHQNHMLQKSILLMGNGDSHDCFLKTVA